MWQVCCMREIEVKIDEMDFLRKLVLSENDDNNENDDTKTENDN
jgi:hypothetical protein